MDSPTALIARPDAVLLGLSAESRESVLRLLHEQLAACPGVTDAPRLLHDVLERAMLAPVCIADDIALPHARTEAVARLVLGVARLVAPGTGFDAEHPRVRLVFMVGAPRTQPDSYLEMVAGISRLLRAEGVRAALLAAKDETAFRAVLARGAGV